MSAYQGRRAPNVSQFLAELNTIPTPQEVAAQNQSAGLELDNDLALFTNTEFIDFDMGDFSEFNSAPDFDPNQQERLRGQGTTYKDSSVKAEEYATGDFPFPAYPAFSNAISDVSTNLNHAQSSSYQIPNQSSPIADSPISPKAGAFGGDKLKLDGAGPSGVASAEDAARFAAEEDKRRRNTAASARFRVKKKQREQALEKTAKEMTEKVSILQSKVNQLETENKWLKELLTEKHDKKASEVTDTLRNPAEGNVKARSIGERTDGVGTIDV